jgi:hypothetical protein
MAVHGDTSWSTIRHWTLDRTTYLSPLNTSLIPHFSLLGIFAAQRQRRHESPLLVTNITRIVASIRHDSIVPETESFSRFDQTTT